MPTLCVEKGSALVLVLGVVMAAALVISGLYTLLRARITDLQIAADRMSAQYLCEAGVSVAVLDIRHGRIRPGNEQRTFDFPLGAKTHRLHYQVRKVPGSWEVMCSVPSPGGLGLTYKLRLGGRRAFPVFMLGRGL